MRKKIKPPKLVTVAVFTTITIIFWIFFGVYNILTSEAEVDIEPELLKPIDPTLNTQVLNELPGKTFYRSSEDIDLQLYDEQSAESEQPPEEEDQQETEDDQPEQEEDSLEPTGTETPSPSPELSPAPSPSPTESISP